MLIVYNYEYFQEFYLHLLTVMERENRKKGQTDHAFHSLQFKVEDRLECGSSKQVSLFFTPAILKGHLFF